MKRRDFVFAAALLAPGLALAQPPQKSGRAEPAIRDVRRGDPLRKQLLDTLRPIVEQEIGAPVLFTVKAMRVSGRFAYFVGESRQANGQPFDFSKTKLKELVDEGLFDGPRTSAYFERANDGVWTVRDWQIGSTDFPDPGWPDDFGGPRALVIPGRR